MWKIKDVCLELNLLLYVQRDNLFFLTFYLNFRFSLNFS